MDAGRRAAGAYLFGAVTILQLHAQALLASAFRRN